MSEPAGSEYSEASPRKSRGRPRGRSWESTELIEAMHNIAEVAQPITGRGIGYKLFVAGLIDSMSTKTMQKVYRLLKEAREEGIIPWQWIVDETRALERVPTWADPEEYASCVTQSYRRDFWDQQPHRVQVWSEKGTVRGVLKPVLDKYAVGFNPVHGFNSATDVHNICSYNNGRPLIILYVGDYDPSGLCMSESDLPKRISKYQGDHITLKRIAITREQTGGLLSFPADDKDKDMRFQWFTDNYGDQRWELDAMDPRDLRALVEKEIKKLIEPVAWERCEIVNKVEQASIQSFAETLKDIGKPAPRLEWEFNWPDAIEQSKQKASQDIADAGERRKFLTAQTPLTSANPDAELTEEDWGGCSEDSFTDLCDDSTR